MILDRDRRRRSCSGRCGATPLSGVAGPLDWSQGDGSTTDRLWLADWRRRIATLYAEVRAPGRHRPGAALAHWRAVREALFREHPQSPVPRRGRRAAFRARHFDHDPRLRFEVGRGTGPAAGRRARSRSSLPNSGADTLSFSRIGDGRVCRSPTAARDARRVFWMAGYAGGLFIPFRDATNGTETYGAGRYLVDAAKSADLGGDPASGHARSSTSTSPSSRRARSTRAGPARSRRPRTASTSPIRAGERLA